MDDLPLNFINEGHNVSVKIFGYKSNLFAERDGLFESFRSYSDAVKGNGANFMCCWFSKAII